MSVHALLSDVAFGELEHDDDVTTQVAGRSGLRGGSTRHAPIVLRLPGRPAADGRSSLVPGQPPMRIGTSERASRLARRRRFRALTR